MGYIADNVHRKVLQHLIDLGAKVEDSDHVKYGVLVNGKYELNTLNGYYGKPKKERAGQSTQDFYEIVKKDLDPDFTGDAMEDFINERKSHESKMPDDIRRALGLAPNKK